MSSIITVTEEQTIVTETDGSVLITTSDDVVIVEQADSGPQGAEGPEGPQGAQGTPGADGTGDKTFETDFTNQSTVTVIHNLGKYVSVVVIDSAGDICEGYVDQTSKNQLTVSFSAPFSGSIVCN